MAATAAPPNMPSEIISSWLLQTRRNHIHKSGGTEGIVVLEVKQPGNKLSCAPRKMAQGRI